MNAVFNLRRVDARDIDSIITFAKDNPWQPQWPPTLMRRFMTQLISGPELIFDIHDKAERTGTAVLIDKIKNRGNLANLEILSLRRDIDPIRTLEFSIMVSKERLPAGKKGFEIAMHHDLTGRKEIIERAGLRPYYETYEMENTSPEQHGCDDEKLVSASTDNESMLYETLVAVFEENIDTSIPSFEDWRAGRRETRPLTWLAKREEKIAGFINLTISADGKMAEIATLGVLKRWRRQGIARALIGKALAHVAKENIPACHLTVSCTNRSALELYKKSGFSEASHYHVYQWQRPAA